MSEKVTGYIDHVIFRNDENGYTVTVSYTHLFFQYFRYAGISEKQQCTRKNSKKLGTSYTVSYTHLIIMRKKTFEPLW